MIEIIPSPGTQDKNWEDIAQKIEKVKGFAKTVHIDVIDGKFAKNTTFSDPNPFKECMKHIAFEVHLMVENPVQYLKSWADVGCQRFIGQIEKMPDQVEFVAQGQLLGEVLLALDRETPVSAINVPLSDLDGLLVMTIQAGFSGQTFVPTCLEKVKILRKQTNIPIEVDGGINDQTILEARRAGADRFVATSFIFQNNPEEQFKKLQKVISGMD